jgi:branched-chain amino acid aminotransferase
MGLFPLEVKVDVTIAVWEWGSYLGEAGKKEGIRAKLSTWKRMSDESFHPKAKAGGQYLNSILAKVESHQGGYDEAIMLDHEGFVSEGSGENIFVVRDGTVITPPAGSPILEGISRDSIITIAGDLGIPVEQRNIGREELVEADEVFLTGTAAELVPVREIDDRPVGSGGPGEVTLQLQSTFEDALHGRAEKYRHWLDPVPGIAATAEPEAGVA